MIRKPGAHAVAAFAFSAAFTMAAAAAEPASVAAKAAEIPLKDFAQPPEFQQVEISPNGEYLAVTFAEGDQDDLVTIRLADKKILARQQMGEGFRIDDLWWVGPKRIVLALAQQQGTLAQPARTGELLGVNFDGSNSKYLFGYRAAQAVGTHIQGAEIRYASATMINPLPDDPSSALIAIRDWGQHSTGSVTSWSSGESTGPVEIARLNVNSGTVNPVDTAPIPGYVSFLADDKGIARFAVGSDDHGNTQTYVRRVGDAAWQSLNTGDFKKAEIYPQALSADGTRATLVSNEGEDRFCLVEQDLTTGARKKLSCDSKGDVNSAVLSFDGHEAIGANYGSVGTETRLFDTTNPDRARIAKLLHSFPGQSVQVASHTNDGSVAIIQISGEHNPGDYYLFYPKTLKAEYLASKRSWIDPEQAADRKILDFKSRDGQLIHGILTVPVGRSAHGLPLIVNPHGGPFDIFDSQIWDPEPEMLASRGYAVLQVNFRGSGGYGTAYTNAGKRGWDTVMINDITDATLSLIEQGAVDKSRICIYGGSYGGYAALMSAVREPGLYRCVIGYAGAYDLNALRKDSDSTQTALGQTIFNENVGVGEQRLKAASPLTYIDQLKAPVMIVHGASDERAPIGQARELRKALDERKLSYEWLIKDNEGHGFAKPEDLTEFYTKMLAFIEKNIGPGAPVETAAAPAAASPAN